MGKPKLKYRRQQIAALKKLYKGYTNGKGLEDCPLCNIKDLRCRNCVWDAETDYYCGFPANKVLGMNAVEFRDCPKDYPKQAKARAKQIKKWIAKYE